MNTTLTTNSIVAELTNRGYNAEATQTVKNGVTLEGVCIRSGNIGAIIYMQNLITCASVEEATEKAIEIYESHKDPEIDTTQMSSPDFILNHVYIGLQRSSEQDLYKIDCPFEDVEAYLYVRINDDMTYKMTPDMISAFSLDAKEVEERARANTFSISKINSLAEILGICELENPIGVISNENRSLGASAILDTEALKGYCKARNISKLIIIPSSIHECLLIDANTISTEEASAMVTDVNATQVDPCEQLADHVFTFEC